MSMAEAAEAMDAQLVAGSAQQCFCGIAVDSRTIRGGELFFALPGAQADGHDYLERARAAGGVGAVISDVAKAREVLGGSKNDQEDQNRPAAPFALLEARDPYASMHELTRSVRRRTPRHLLGITGSAGKTTTKEMLAAMLARRYRTAASPGNLNNLYGFPVSLLSIDEQTEWMVAEMGMSTPGELGAVSRLARPDVALFTNVREAHLEAFDALTSDGAGLDEIAHAKAELLDGLSDEGLVVANVGDERVLWIARRHQSRGGRVLGFAFDEALTEDIERPLDMGRCELAVPIGGGERLGSRFELKDNSGSVTSVELALHGRVNVENFLGAATCAFALGVSLEEISAAASELTPGPGRGRLLRLLKATVVDDTYNSNPSALRHAIDAAVELPGQRHWAVLGEMRELGRRSAELHRESGRYAAERGLELVVAIGREARVLADAAAAFGCRALWFEDAVAAAQAVRAEIQAQDVVLVKGSRGVRLERLLDALHCDEEVHG